MSKLVKTNILFCSM